MEIPLAIETFGFVLSIEFAMSDPSRTRKISCRFALICVVGGLAIGQSSVPKTNSATKTMLESELSDSDRPEFEELKREGALRSRYREHEFMPEAGTASEPALSTYRADIEPILSKTCFRCHGAKRQRGNVRIDTLNPDLFAGGDVDWWLEVLTVLSNDEMPPEGEAELSDKDRGKVIEWLAKELQAASSARRLEKAQSSFRRMTRYEYEYALQDLLGLPYSFAEDLPPDPTSEDGFQNSSEVLHLTAMQLSAYLDSAREALRLATVRGARPAPKFWGVSMQAAAAVEWARQDRELEEIRQKHKDDPQKSKDELERRSERFRTRPKGVHFEDRQSGRTAGQSWSYGEAKFAWLPETSRPELSHDSTHVAIIPAGEGLIVELGDQIPENGSLRVRVRASRASIDDERIPSMQLVFGWQASNDSHASVRISQQDLVVDAAPGIPELYQWDVPLSQIYPRNTVRGISKMGDLPSPSEYVKLLNASVSDGDIHVHHVEVMAPVHEMWPPSSHTRVFFGSDNERDETAYAREVLHDFLPRAWRREASPAELEQKLELFNRLRPQFDGFQEAMCEVLATVLCSPNFLYIVVQSAPSNAETDGDVTARLTDIELATRLSIFLWCSTPDDELQALAQEGHLKIPEVLSSQVDRMLSDPRSRRFSTHFVRQWLGLSLLDYLHVDANVYPQFDASLREAMREEPIAFFHEILQSDDGALEFIHSSFTMANERLAKHYGWTGVFGNHFRRVEIGQHEERGGLLTQAGLLAMNSDGKDSHPLKRGIWMLERLLNDPPPPPPPAVPEINLADPEIAKLTLKQRIENHRDHPACMSCHAKIDPWGIAFENYDAVGSWRTEVQGHPVDSEGVLFNEQRLDGMDGLKGFLLENRQDQFVRSMVYKLTAYALGRPLTFGDRAGIDRITGETRKRGDGLATMVKLIATSSLFQTK
ncbi:MAG: mono/diheme cytochrome c family protein [Planctomycetota bacterium]|jgi:mono/diheme cytochrome c family protein